MLLVPIIIVWGIFETIFRWILNIMIGIALVMGMLLGLTIMVIGGVIYAVYSGIKRAT
jgi:hypothetical protein